MHAHEPETIYVVPIKSDGEHYPPEGKLRVYRSRSGWQRLGSRSRRASPQRDCYVDILRDAMAVDSLDSCGVYFGTSGGEGLRVGRLRRHLAGDRRAICRVVLSLEVQTFA